MRLDPLRRALPAVLAMLLSGAALAAHHSVLGFDGDRPVTVSGRIAEVLWQNPHTYIHLDVANDGRTEQWTIESEAAGVLRRLGWRQDVLTPGAVVTITGARARDGRRVLRCAFLELASGKRLPGQPGRDD